MEWGTRKAPHFMGIFDAFNKIDGIKQELIDLCISEAMEKFDIKSRDDGYYLIPEKKKEVFMYMMERMKVHQDERGIYFDANTFRGNL